MISNWRDTITTLASVFYFNMQVISTEASFCAAAHCIMQLNCIDRSNCIAFALDVVSDQGLHLLEVFWFQIPFFLKIFQWYPGLFHVF